MLSRLSHDAVGLVVVAALTFVFSGFFCEVSSGMRFFIGLVALVAVVSSQGVSNSTSVSPGVVAWIDDKGSVVSSSVPLNVTRIAAGHYCIAGNGTKSPINNGFLPTFVTLQNMGRGKFCLWVMVFVDSCRICPSVVCPSQQWVG